MKRVTVAFELRSAAGVTRGELAIEEAPMRLAALVPLAQQLTDVVVDASIASEAEQGRALSCKAGCGACCRQYVPISAPEAFFLVDALRQYPQEQREQFSKRREAIAKRLADQGIYQRLMDPRGEPESALGALGRDYFRLGEACPFLIDESCAIHAHRPTPCRDYNVTSPAELCNAPYSQPIQKVPTPGALTAPLAKLTAKLTGEPAELIPLSLVEPWVADHQALAGRSWPGPDLVQQFLSMAQGSSPRSSR